jgi:low affinity Fe/Cu permease
MEPTQDRSRGNVLGRNMPRGRKPTRAEWRLHSKTAMGAAMIIANVFLQNTFAVDLVEDYHVIETIAAYVSDQALAHGIGLG